MLLLSPLLLFLVVDNVAVVNAAAAVDGKGINLLLL